MSGEETIGLILAVALHGAVLAALLFSPHGAPPKLPERIAVTLSNDIGLTSTSPEPAARAAADVAPTIGDAQPAPPEPVPAPPEPVHEAPPPPEPRAVAKPEPRTPPKPATPKRAASAPAPATAPPKRVGGQRIGADFLKGVGADPGTSHSSPAAAIGAGVVASLSSAISRQIKPNWNAPDGVDVDKLATTIEWDLNPDGTLAGAPRFVTQTGVSGSNRAQAQRHIEQAMRAVRLSAPYPLPPKYYAAWKRVRFTFDWKLDQ